MMQSEEKSSSFTRNPRTSGLVAGGFTLIELLVVIAIIGLLGSIVLASLSSARAKAQAAKLTADFRQIRTTIGMVQNSTLISITGSGCSACFCMGGVDTAECVNQMTSVFVTKLGMSTLPRDPWGSPYSFDENELESGALDCRYDFVISAGPNRTFNTYDGQAGDDIGCAIPVFTCPAGTPANAPICPISW